MKRIEGTPYEVASTILSRLEDIAARVSEMRKAGKLSPEVLGRLRKFFKIKNIYSSNAIEGNVLKIGETRLVVERGLTLTGVPLRDQAEARNLSAAVDYLEELAKDTSRPITESDVRQLHYLVLKTIRDSDAGKYRSEQVEISGSKYKPPGPEKVPSQMEDFGRWLTSVSVPSESSFEDALLIASAAHSWMVTVHPFVDGNGRVARLVLNLLLMRFGYPIAIITKEDRNRYYDALEESQASDLTGVVALVMECLEESLEEYEAAAKEQREHEEWAQSIVGKLQRAELVRASNQYEVWRNAMELLKSVFRQTVEIVDASAPMADVWFKDFGNLDIEKYLALKNYTSAKKTWFFRLDFKSGEKVARYLFFFGAPSYILRSRCDVTLFIAREEPSGSFFYERIEYITAPNAPNLVEIGYDMRAEEFVAHRKDGSVANDKVEAVCRTFFDEVVQKHFSS